MTNQPVTANSESDEDGGVSTFALASMLVRRRWLILVMGIGGGLLGLTLGLTSPRLYSSTATFVPQAPEGAATGLALAASQFGIRVPASGTWGPAVYVALLRSWGLLRPIAHDTLTVAEEGGKRVAVMDIFKIRAPTPTLRSDQAVRALSGSVIATEDKKLNAVRLTVVTRWPSVSFGIAERLISGVNAFNLQTRKSQATAERQFVETQAAEAERALRDAQNKMQSFLQANRMCCSPELSFQRDRLTSEVELRQQVYASLIHNREDAKLREVRDTPVITVLEEPRIPVVGEPRRSIQKGFLGGLVGGGLAVLIAFLTDAVSAARRKDSPEAREFFSLLERTFPRLSRARGRP